MVRDCFRNRGIITSANHDHMRAREKDNTGLDIQFDKSTAKAFAKNVFINQERKLKVRRRLDTALVLTINDAS